MSEHAAEKGNGPLNVSKIWSTKTSSLPHPHSRWREKEKRTWKMALKLLLSRCCPETPPLLHPFPQSKVSTSRKIHINAKRIPSRTRRQMAPQRTIRRNSRGMVSASLQPLDLTEDNVNKVLADARIELGQLFDTSVGITGEAELAELDGPFVKIRLRGRFWHKRSTVLARLDNYLRNRIPEILEVDIEDEKQLNDSAENF